MTGQFEGKVAFITGAARGQGRSHAVRFAGEGADIIAIDICDQIDSVAYPMATPEDLQETVNLVEKTGRRIVAQQADVRDFEQLQAVVADGVAELGRLDFVLANAGIGNLVGEQSHDIAAYLDGINVMLNGVYFTVEAALPAMLAHGDGGAIVMTNSGAGFKSPAPSFRTSSRGAAGYTAAKHGGIGLMRFYATTLAEKKIRVNSVHPCGVATPMIEHEAGAKFFAEFPEFVAGMQTPMGVPMIESSDITEAMVYLCGQSGRYVTGITLPVDAGFAVV